MQSGSNDAVAQLPGTLLQQFVASDDGIYDVRSVFRRTHLHIYRFSIMREGLVLDVELTQLLVDVTLLEGVTFHVCLLHCLVCLSVFTLFLASSHEGL